MKPARRERTVKRLLWVATAAAAILVGAALARGEAASTRCPGNWSSIGSEPTEAGEGAQEDRLSARRDRSRSSRRAGVLAARQ